MKFWPTLCHWYSCKPAQPSQWDKVSAGSMQKSSMAWLLCRGQSYRFLLRLVRVACQSSAWGKTPELGSVPDLIYRSMTKCCFACFFLSDVSEGLLFILPLFGWLSALLWSGMQIWIIWNLGFFRWSPLLYLLVLLFLWEYLGNSRNICVPG